jgi:hypothetical protein
VFEKPETWGFPMALQKAVWGTSVGVLRRVVVHTAASVIAQYLGCTAKARLSQQTDGHFAAVGGGLEGQPAWMQKRQL